MTDENLQACKTRCFSPIDSRRYCELDNIQVTHVGRQVLSDGKDLDPEEVLNELISSTGAWKSWSSQFLFSKFYERVVDISIAGKDKRISQFAARTIAPRCYEAKSSIHV